MCHEVMQIPGEFELLGTTDLDDQAAPAVFHQPWIAADDGRAQYGQRPEGGGAGQRQQGRLRDQRQRPCHNGRTRHPTRHCYLPERAPTGHYGKERQQHRHFGQPPHGPSGRRGRVGDHRGDQRQTADEH
ncbi:hypothetical protein OG754_23090 [Streptomyces decoyicus]|uniref:hypothetical protein n=1 Tax=Streptomyces decoyicus TaxID=249567 RepID=UPI002E33042B|nr:hypothetical protein [Streptomyces decoyicus]